MVCPSELLETSSFNKTRNNKQEKIHDYKKNFDDSEGFAKEKKKDIK